MTTNKWLIYAPGIGIGHFNRSMCLAQVAALHNINVTILTNCPLIEKLTMEIPANIDVQMLWKMPKKKYRKFSALKIKKSKADVVIIDAFPLGVSRELEKIIPKVCSYKVFIHRLCNPDFLPKNSFQFLDHYSKIFVPGENAPLEHHPKVTKTNIWFSLPQAQMLSRKKARLSLGGNANPIIVVIGCGSFKEASAMKKVAEYLQEKVKDKAHVVFASPSPSQTVHSISVWPLYKLYNGIDLIVGQGGYNTVNECRVSGTPLLAFDRKRNLDIQKARLHEHEIVKNNSDVLSKVIAFLSKKAEKKTPQTHINGAEEAFSIIKKAVYNDTPL